MIVVTVQSIFNLEIYQNNFFKKIIFDQYIKTI